MRSPILKSLIDEWEFETKMCFRIHFFMGESYFEPVNESAKLFWLEHLTLASDK